MAKDLLIYKILSAADWLVAEDLGISRTVLDEHDGYVHLSTREQVGETLALHYRNMEHTRLMEFNSETLAEMGEVRWEESRGGDLFPHLYGSLKVAEARRHWTLDLNKDGLPCLPEDI